MRRFEAIKLRSVLASTMGAAVTKVHWMALEALNVSVPRQLLALATGETVEQGMQRCIEDSFQSLCVAASCMLVIVNTIVAADQHYGDIIPKWMLISSSWSSFLVFCLIACQATLTHLLTLYNSSYQIYIDIVKATKQME